VLELELEQLLTVSVREELVEPLAIIIFEVNFVLLETTILAVKQ